MTYVCIARIQWVWNDLFNFTWVLQPELFMSQVFCKWTYLGLCRPLKLLQIGLSLGPYFIWRMLELLLALLLNLSFLMLSLEANPLLRGAWELPPRLKKALSSSYFWSPKNISSNLIVMAGSISWWLQGTYLVCWSFSECYVWISFVIL